MEDSKVNSKESLDDLHSVGRHRVSFFSGHEPEAAFAFFHGFPGIRSRQNRDLAEMVSHEIGFDSYVFHYAGLKVVPGPFSFVQSIEDSIDFCRQLLGRYGRLHLVGHSFGGLVACEVLRQFQEAIGSLTLLSPLVDFEIQDDSRKRISTEVRESYPDLFSDADELRLLDEWKILYKHFRPILHTDSLSSTPCLILQSKDDPYTPEPITLRLVRAWRGPIQYLEVHEDHSFLTDRSSFRTLFVSEIASLMERCS